MPLTWLIGPADVIHRLIRRPDAARIVDLRCVVAPREVRGREFVGEGRVIEARDDLLAVRACARDRVDEVLRSADAAPVREREVDGIGGLPGDEILMRDEARVQVRCEHAIADDELLAHRKVRAGLALRDERVGCGTAGNAALAIEPVHASAVVVGVVVGKRMAVAAGRRERQRVQRHRLTVGAQAAACRIGVRKPVEEVVEAAVLLHDDDDVLNLSRAWNRERRRRRLLRRRDDRRP